MEIIEQIKSIQSAFLALKDGVENSSRILLDLLNNDKNSIEINKNETAYIVNLILFDSIISKEIGYSIFDDFDFSQDNIISIKNTNKDICKKNINFLVDYLNYRIENPIDLAEC